MEPALQPTPVADPTIAALNAKIDALTDQVAFLTEEARRQQAQRREWQELRADLTPVALDAYQIAVHQLEELEPHVQLEDFLYVFKKLLRNTRNLGQMIDQLESLAELGRDAGPLSQDAFIQLMHRLNELEQRGYFAFAAGGADILDRVVTHFTPEDLHLLGDNVVLILETIKEMTQPEVMLLLRQTAATMRDEEIETTPSLFALMRQLNDPSVRRGLARTLNVMKQLA